VVFATDGSDTLAAVPDSVRPPPGRYQWLIEASGYSMPRVTAVGTVVLR